MPDKPQQDEELFVQPESVPSQEPNNSPVTQFSQSVTIISAFPPPQELAGYESVLPGGADRLLKMVESEQAHRQQVERFEQQHRHDMDKRLIQDRAARYLVGRITTGLLAFTLTAASVSLIAFNKPVEGLVILAGEVGLMVTGSSKTGHGKKD